MSNNNYEFSFLTDKSTNAVFHAINNVRVWWNSEMEGDSTHLNDEFSVKFWDLHYSKQKVVEFVPDKKIVWLVTESRLSFLADKNEWTGTKISFELGKKGGQTEVHFMHEGLVPKIECYHECSKAWTEYLRDSLLKFITTGEGQPYLDEAKAGVN
jgi:hypothetical protein